MFYSADTATRRGGRPNRFGATLLLGILTLVAIAAERRAAAVQPAPAPAERLLEAQVEHLKAQTEYYRAQLNKPPEERWGQFVSGLLGSIIGAGAALLGASLTNRERRREERLKEKQVAIADLLRKLSEGIQAASWVTWRPESKGTRQLKDELTEYESEMKKIFPGVVGARAVIAALDAPAHAGLSQLVDELYSLDNKIGKVKLTLSKAALESEQQEIKDKLDQLHSRADNLDKAMLRKVAEILTGLK